MDANDLRWDGRTGHYEVWYVSATDPASGVGLWLRFTVHAPLRGDAECALWFLAMERDGWRFARKATFAVERLEAEGDPFRLRLAGADLSDRGRRARSARTAPGSSRGRRACLPPATSIRCCAEPGSRGPILVLAHPALELSGTVRLGERTLALDRARGGQAHLWGSEHAARWAWTHAQRPARGGRLAAAGRLPRRRLGLRAAARGASSGPARRWSRACSATTSARPRRCAWRGPRAASG